MSLPQYSDLGKIAKDLFTKGFNYNAHKLDAKVNTLSGVNFNLVGEIKKEKLTTTLEAKYKNVANGVTLVEKFGTDNTFKSELTLEDNFAKGLKIVADATLKNKLSFNTECTYVYDKNLTLKSKYSYDNKHSAVLKSLYKRQKFLLNTDMDVSPSAGPILHSALVVGHSGWLLGLQNSLDTAKLKFSKNNFSVGYATKDFALHTNLDDFDEFNGFVFQKLDTDLDVGASVTFKSKKAAEFGLASKYTLNNSAAIQVKVNNLHQIGLAYSHQLRNGVKLVASTLIDGQNLNGGCHCVGLSLELS